MCTNPSEHPSDRYAADVVSLNRDLSFRNLARQDPAIFTHFAERGDGLVTLSVPTRHLPHRYLIGLQGFRLAQYLQLGWACSSVAYRQAIFCEPVGVAHADDQHIITMNPTGRILGYVSLATNGDDESRDLFDPARAAFPVEEAHGVNIFDHVAPLPRGGHARGARAQAVRPLAHPHRQDPAAAGHPRAAPRPRAGRRLVDPGRAHPHR